MSAFEQSHSFTTRGAEIAYRAAAGECHVCSSTETNACAHHDCKRKSRVFCEDHGVRCQGSKCEHFFCERHSQSELHRNKCDDCAYALIEPQQELHLEVA